MKILVTGATGFVGRHVIRALSNCNVEITLIVREGKEDQTKSLPNVTKIVSTKNLFNENIEWWAKRCINIDTILHLAWYVEPGQYLQSEKNIDCLVGSLNLVKGAIQAGIKKFVGIGTCFEYDLSKKDLSVDTPLKPNSLYGITKAALFSVLADWLSKSSVEFTWCRLFYLYGEGQDPRNLVPYLRSRLEKNDLAKLTTGTQIRDYLNVSDAAKKIAEIVIGRQVGAINICSGIPITIRQLAEKIADEYGKRELLKFGARPNNFVDPPYIVGISNLASQKS
jgi:nucleoside-diphosphate-sugar epimerase